LAKQDNTNVLGYKFDNVGITIGYDCTFASNPNLTIGAAASFAKEYFRHNSYLSAVSINTYALGIYGSYKTKKTIYLSIWVFSLCFK
jgi:outer membrane autotransporter protein